ncbi:MAG: hypothetical protein E7582_03750 [Ruminococcaceae bacterium]|nr:hypothetical protein [Oscillospiraceae bacterium]
MDKNNYKESERRRKAYERNRKIKLRQQRRNRTKRFLILTFILYLFVILAIFFAFSISLKSCEKEEPQRDINIQHQDDKVETIKKSDLYFDGICYLPISVINKLTDIKVTGDKDNINFIIEENSEYANFNVGSKLAEINSNAIELSSEAKIVNGELYLPLDFFTTYMTGLTIKIDDKKDVYVLSAESTPQFIFKEPENTTPVDENGVTDITDSPMDFLLDLSSYEEYMNPKDRDAYLILVSEENPLTSDYAPDDLTGSIYTRSDRDTRMLRKYACLALEAFLKEAEANGIKNVTVTSAYRSYDYQNQLFVQEVAIRGSEEEAAKHVNPPGISEHQTGLAVDMHNMSAASTAFGNTKEGKWLEENAHKFGFILRYPSDKTKITGINYEPWHFRYVGRYHATKMHELDMCLEEYIEYINQ